MMKQFSTMCKKLQFSVNILYFYNILYRDCLGFCFQHLVQEDLDKIREEWNSHRIRANRNSSGPPGYPNELYFLPEIQGIRYNISGKYE